MAFFQVGPIIIIAIIACASFILFLAGHYLVSERMAGGPIFAGIWTAITIAPVFVGIPLLFFRAV